MKKIYNINTDSWSFPDGSGLETREWQIRRDLIVDKAKMLGLEGKRNWKEEFEEVNKLLKDKDELDNNK